MATFKIPTQKECYEAVGIIQAKVGSVANRLTTLDNSAACYRDDEGHPAPASRYRGPR